MGGVGKGSFKRNEVSLKREVGLFGAFSMGYADVGADIYMAMGIVFLFSAGAAPLSFLIAAIAYITVCFAYAELSSTYPLAGGAQIFAARGLGDHMGFLAGWFLILSYIVDITLFALSSSGYLSFLFPFIREFSIGVGPLYLNGLILMTIILIGFLILINIIGIRESAVFTEVLVAIDLIVESFILGAGLFLILQDPSKLLSNLGEFGAPGVHEDVSYIPGLDLNFQNFLYGTTLAMSSFVGIESIAQASEEIKRPYKWIPIATKLSAVSVLIFAIGISIAALGTAGWEAPAVHREMSMVIIMRSVPIIGSYASILVAFTGFVITLASSNTGVIGVSRVIYSMGKFRLMPGNLSTVNKRFRTPVRAIIFSGIVAILMSFLGELERIADVYTVAGLLSYLLVHLSLPKLRKIDRDAYRPWRAPGDLKIGGREINLVAAIGLLSVGSLLSIVILLHKIGRSLALLWLLIGILTYVSYRKSAGLPVLGRVSAEEMRPAEYRRSVIAFIRPYEDEDVAEDIAHALKGRYKVHLTSIIDPEGLSSEEIEEERMNTQRILNRIASELRGMGLEVTYRIEFGKPREVAISFAEADIYDFILVIIGRGTRKLEEPGLARLLMEKFPGKVIAVRR